MLHKGISKKAEVAVRRSLIRTRQSGSRSFDEGSQEFRPGLPETASAEGAQRPHPLLKQQIVSKRVSEIHFQENQSPRILVQKNSKPKNTSRKSIEPSNHKGKRAAVTDKKNEDGAGEILTVHKRQIQFRKSIDGSSQVRSHVNVSQRRENDQSESKPRVRRSLIVDKSEDKLRIQ